MIPVDYVIQDNTWGQFLKQDHPVRGTVERVGVLPAGTERGRPVLEMLVRLEGSGVGVVAEVPLADIVSAVTALGARYAREF